MSKYEYAKTKVLAKKQKKLYSSLKTQMEILEVKNTKTEIKTYWRGSTAKCTDERKEFVNFSIQNDRN